MTKKIGSIVRAEVNHRGCYLADTTGPHGELRHAVLVSKWIYVVEGHHAITILYRNLEDLLGSLERPAPIPPDINFSKERNAFFGHISWKKIFLDGLE